MAVALLLLIVAFVGILVGGPIKTALTGVFGFSAYLLLAVLLVITVISAFHLLRARKKARLIIFAALLSFVFFAYLQIVTSHKLYAALAEPSFKGYLSSCYAAGIGTAGGALFGIIVYPVLALMGKYAAIPMAVLFFVILFFALFPFMKISASDAERQGEGKKKKSSRKKGKEEGEEPLRLFVDKVREGEKDADVIKRRRGLSKPDETYKLFDVYDTTSVLYSDSVVPPVTPERYSPYRDDRSAASDYDDEYDPTFVPEPSENSRPSWRSDPMPQISDDEMPRFMRHAVERAEATKKLYGDERLKGVIPEEPTYGAPAEPKKAPLRPTPLVDLPKKRPVRGSVDIIEDLDDLKRVNAQNAAPKMTREKFIGEEPEPISKSPVAEKEETVIPEKAESVPPVKMAEIPEPEEDLPDDFEPEEEEEEIPYIPPRSTITPSEASVMKPVEPKREASESAYRPSPRPVAPTPLEDLSYDESEEEEIAPIIRQRKPRSDIGGTHRSPSAPPQQSTYIPPKKAEQVDMVEVMEEVPMRPYTAPPVQFLTEYPPMKDEEGVEEKGEALVQALASFNIHSEVIDHKTGPTFTQFAVSLPDNMSVNKLTPLEKDIKRKLKIEKNIRIIPSVPGLDAVGFEVPNEKTSMIGLRSLINAPEFEKENKLYFAIGVDVSGRAVYGDLLKMPHLLVAGSTGSGKSVCLNVLICSILYHYSPEFVRFIMIDPKKVELSVYKNMPHMVMPNTVTEVSKAINALTWAVNEMERRYDILQENSCRNIAEYNELQKKKGGKKMYYIVIIVDEMADLMTRAKKDVEDKINSLTSKARAAGIHLVVATQRPSVDVITGTIKNNIPTRIAFKVTSMNDSRTILEKSGAESLFGNGDMLYCPPNGGEPVRLQGPFLDDEVLSIVNYIKEHNDCSFDGEAEKIIQAEKPTEQDASALPTNVENGEEEDEVLQDALLFVIESGQASISKLQRKFRLGYARAARIIDIMEDRGYIGPTDSSNKPRAVLITKEQYYEIYNDDGIEGDESR